MSQLKNKVFWDYFLATGNIGVYLILRELEQKKYKFLRRNINS